VYVSGGWFQGQNNRAYPMKIFLIAWSTVAFVWWLIALALLVESRRRNLSASLATRATITVFKPLPPVRNEQERDELAEAIGSFISQLKLGDELLIGMNVAAAVGWQGKIQAWHTAWPAAQITVIARAVPDQCANPKIAWLQVLAPSARGEVWLWSDTDVTAPSGFLDDICAQLAASGKNAVTAPYRVQQVGRAHEMLDALFVNLEFLPGTLLLGRLNHQDFAYGAATAFRMETFHDKGDWQKLGSALADDHKLGELLQPVALSSALVSTIPNLNGWGEAWQHYYRWQKTVRWCRPADYAALLVLMPAFGWAMAGLVVGSKVFFISGFIAVLVGEMLVAVLACQLVGCRLPPATWFGVLSWPFARVITWLLVWLPLPVLWSGRQRAWFAPNQK
jgi:ceramide glucosyltransferase